MLFRKKASPAQRLNRLSDRVTRLEQAVRALKAGQQQGEEPDPARIAEETKAALEQEKQRQLMLERKELDYVVATNVLADASRLLSDALYGGVGAPRRGVDPQHEDIRLSTATGIVGSVQEDIAHDWLNYQPTVNKTWINLPMHEARQSFVADLRNRVASRLAANEDGTLQNALVDINDEPARSGFNRLNRAPNAVREGIELAHAVIFNVLDQLQADVPGLGKVNAAEESAAALKEAMDITQAEINRSAATTAQAPKTHEELYNQKFLAMTRTALQHAFGIAASGADTSAYIQKPLRLAGAILTEMCLPQPGILPGMEKEDIRDLESHNSYPAESPRAVQMREIARVCDSIQHSLYDGQLRLAVSQLYMDCAAEVFPHTPPKPVTPQMHGSGYLLARDLLEGISCNLTDALQIKDGWSLRAEDTPSSQVWARPSKGPAVQ